MSIPSSKIRRPQPSSQPTARDFSSNNPHHARRHQVRLRRRRRAGISLQPSIRLALSPRGMYIAPFPVPYLATQRARARLLLAIWPMLGARAGWTLGELALPRQTQKCNLQFQQCIVDENAGTGKKPSYIKVFCDSIAPVSDQEIRSTPPKINMSTVSAHVRLSPTLLNCAG